MKFSKLFKKAAALCMAAVTALSLIPATTAFAAGDIGTISFSHTYDSGGNAMRYNSSATINGYTAGGTGNYKYRMSVDGETAFCIQPGVPLKTGNTLKKASSDTWNALSANQKKAVGLALLYGYQGNRSNLMGSDDEKWLATQTLVWEFVTGCREATGSYRQTSTTVYSLHFGSNYANSGARAAYDQIVSLMSRHNTIPSFLSGGKNDITKELAYKDGKYSITLTDKNGVLSDYSFTSSDANVSVSKDGNKLTISSKKAISGSVRITATRNGVPTVSDSARLIAYGDPNLQDLVTGVENADSVKAYINVETPTGTIALKKTSEDGVVAGISFHIKGDGFDKTVKTDANGSLTVEGLFPATYTITEQPIDRYEPQQTQTVTLIGGKTTTVNFNNTLKRGSLEVVKTSEDSLVEGVKFHLYGTSLSGLPVDEYAMWKFLRAGYMEQWTYHETYSGSPQGSGVSPILANIYLNELDEFMARMKKSFDKGDTRSRKVHKDHDKVRWAYRKAQKNLEIERTEANLAAFKEARKVMLSTPHLDEMDENYKRLQYNRYADDFLISITGSKQDAENIKEQVKIFLKDKLNLTMSEEKTHVTHSSEKVRYLGYDIRISRSQDTKRTKKGLQRVWYGKVQLYMPKEKWIAKLHEYGAFKIKKDENGKEIWKPLHRGALMPLDDVAIISKYNSEIRGLYNYYRLAINVCNLGKFHSIMRGSCLKTLAAKYNSSVMKMYKKYRSVKGDFGADYKTKSGTKRCEFYNEGFRRNNNIAPEFVDIMPKYRGQIKPNSLAGRLKSGQCEMCGANPVKVYMHHVKRLKDLNADNEFDELMLLKRRKSLALCPKCYEEAKTKSLKL